MLFFIWYATNVFLTQREKIDRNYVFMGLTNQRIGRLYMIETTMTGMVARSRAGSGNINFKAVSDGLWQFRILLEGSVLRLLSEPVFMTILYFGVIYMLMVVECIYQYCKKQCA